MVGPAAAQPQAQGQSDCMFGIKARGALDLERAIPVHEGIASSADSSSRAPLTEAKIKRVRIAPEEVAGHVSITLMPRSDAVSRQLSASSAAQGDTCLLPAVVGQEESFSSPDSRNAGRTDIGQAWQRWPHFTDKSHRWAKWLGAQPSIACHISQVCEVSCPDTCSTPMVKTGIAGHCCHQLALPGLLMSCAYACRHERQQASSYMADDCMPDT